MPTLKPILCAQLTPDHLALFARHGVTPFDDTRALLPCSRCAGTGHFSYCLAYGTTCFQCGGARYVLRLYAGLVRLLKGREAREAASRRKREARRALEESVSLAVSLDDLWASAREIKQQQIVTRMAAQEWLGTPGGKIDTEATLVRVSEFQGTFGAQIFVVFLHPSGSRITWKTTWSAYPGDLETGDRVRLLANVKSHGEYNDNRVTYVSHVRIHIIKKLEART